MPNSQETSTSALGFSFYTMDRISETLNQLQKHRFVFIGGLHRSGTSLLAKLLAQHPLISSFSGTGVPEDEGQHLQDVFAPAVAYGGAGKFGFVPESHLTEDSDLITDQNRVKLFSQWRRWWDTSRPLFLEKSPPNLIRARFLQALFPESYFIMVLRHPVAVSLATRKWSRTGVHSLLAHWLICHRTFIRDAAYLKHVLVVRYESLVAEPQATIDRLCAFLKIPSHPVDLEIADHNDRYLREWSSRRSDWRSRAYVRYLQLRFETAVNRFGYTLMLDGRFIDQVVYANRGGQRVDPNG